MSSLYSDFKKGFYKEHPIFRQVLGMCPTLAVTTSAINGVGMGLATTFVMVMSNLIVSLLRNLIPDRIRIPCYIVVIASFVTVVDLFMAAFFPPLHQALGIFIPLIVVNCLILGRAEAFASQNPIQNALSDGFGMGLGFTWGLGLLGAVREILGAGSLFGIEIAGASFNPALLMILPPGAFLSLGLMVGFINWWDARRQSGARVREGAAVDG